MCNIASQKLQDVQPYRESNLQLCNPCIYVGCAGRSRNVRLLRCSLQYNSFSAPTWQDELLQNSLSSGVV